MILIRKGRVVSPRNKLSGVMDVLIDGEAIVKLAPELPQYYEDENVRIIEATGCIVTPGLIDIHCHLCEPGFESREDIASGTRAAVRGGFTSIACMPDTQPKTCSAPSVTYILDRARRVGAAHVFPVGTITRYGQGEQLAPIAEMKMAGAVAVSDEAEPTADGGVLRNALKYANSFKMPVLTNCLDRSIAATGVMNEGLVSTLHGLMPIPKSAEQSVVARNVILSLETGCPVHLSHISTEGSVEIVRWGKKMGARVTADTCPQYFSLTEEAVTGYNTMAKLDPPLRAQADVDAVVEGLRDGTIDIISTDHMPCTEDSKIAEFARAAYGMSSLETALAASLTYLYHTGKLSMGDLIYKMTAAPADLLQLGRSELREGARADITIFDPNATWKVRREAFQSKGKNTPYEGMELQGEVISTIVSGSIRVLDRMVMM